MFDKTLKLIISLTITFVLLGPSSSITVLAQDYYKDKTITLLIGFSPGGGSDVQARIYQRHLGKYIPGNPKIVVKNMPGGASLKAQNFMAAKARPDGSIFMFSNFQPMGQLLGEPGVRFKYQDFTWLAAGAGAEHIMYARTDAVPGGIKEPTDIVKAKKLIFTGLRPTSTLDLYGRITLDVLGVDFTYVPGYRGAAKFRAAILRGEGNIAAIGMVGWRSAVEPNAAKKGIVKGLWYWPFSDGKDDWVESVNVPEFPSFIEFYKKVHGKEPSGPKWDALKFVLKLYGTISDMYIGPPNMNKDAAAALSKGLYGMLNDPAAKAEQKKAIGFAKRPISVATAHKVITDMTNADPKMVQFWKDYIASGRGAMPKKK